MTNSNLFRPISPRKSARYAKSRQCASLLAQLKKQEEAIPEATRKLRETQNTLNQLNKQIDETNASIAKLEQQKAAQERSFAAQLDAAFRQGEHTGIQLISAVKKASVDSVYRLISAISTRRDKKPLPS